MKQFRQFLASLSLCMAATAILFAQSAERTVKLAKAQNEPLEVIKLAAAGQEVRFDQAFDAENDDWFRDLRVTVKNVSAQPIDAIDIELIFHGSEAASPPSMEHLFYGCNLALGKSKSSKCAQPPVAPGSAITLLLKDYKSTRGYLTRTGKPQRINDFQLRIGEVIFADGSMFYLGNTFK